MHLKLLDSDMLHAKKWVLMARRHRGLWAQPLLPDGREWSTTTGGFYQTQRFGGVFDAAWTAMRFGIQLVFEKKLLFDPVLRYRPQDACCNQLQLMFTLYQRGICCRAGSVHGRSWFVRFLPFFSSTRFLL